MPWVNFAFAIFPAGDRTSGKLQPWCAFQGDNQSASVFIYFLIYLYRRLLRTTASKHIFGTSKPPEIEPEIPNVLPDLTRQNGDEHQGQRAESGPLMIQQAASRTPLEPESSRWSHYVQTSALLPLLPCAGELSWTLALNIRGTSSSEWVKQREAPAHFLQEERKL